MPPPTPTPHPTSTRIASPSSTQALLSRSIYDARSPTYDTEPTSIHHHQAHSFITALSPQSGHHVLDLATGTGLVALLAKPHVGPTGVVVGIDISDGMLSVGRQKAVREGLDVVFMNADVEDLDAGAVRGFLPEGVQGFDVVTCASALVLLRDPGKAVEAWAGLMAPGGRLMVDVPAEDAMLVGAVLERVGNGLGVGLPFDRSWVRSRESLSEVLVRAGLVVERCWRCEGYGEGAAVLGRRRGGESAGSVFDRVVEAPMFRRLAEDGVRRRAREMFVEEYERLVGDVGGKTAGNDCFYVAIARKE